MKKILLIIILLASCSDTNSTSNNGDQPDLSQSEDLSEKTDMAAAKDLSNDLPDADSDMGADAQMSEDQGSDVEDMQVITRTSKFQMAYDEEWERSKDYYFGQQVVDNGVAGTQYRYYDMIAINGPLAMFQVTGEQKYLDQLFSYLDKVRALATLDPGEYFGNDTYYDWLTNAPENHEAVLYETHGQRDVLKALVVLERYPHLRTWNHPELGSYQALFESYVEFYAVHLWEKWFTRGGHNLYRSRTWMTAHLAQFAMYLRLVDTDASRLEQYNDFLAAHDGVGGKTWADWISKHGGNDRGGLSLNAHIRDENGHAVWSGNWGNFTGYGDVSHTNSGVQYMVNNQVLNGDYSLDLMTKLIKTLNRTLDNSPEADFENIPYSLDGNYNASEDNRNFIHQGWSMLGRYDQTLQTRLESLHLRQATASRYLNLYFGNLAYNQAYLDGELVYPEF